jgi:hypothetical protein
MSLSFGVTASMLKLVLGQEAAKWIPDAADCKKFSNLQILIAFLKAKGHEPAQPKINPIQIMPSSSSGDASVDSENSHSSASSQDHESSVSSSDPSESSESMGSHSSGSGDSESSQGSASSESWNSSEHSSWESSHDSSGRSSETSSDD